MKEISDRVTDALHEVMKYASHVEDWMIIKKELLKILPPEERKSFSTRDPITKLQRTNQFEDNLIEVWNGLRNKIG